MFEQVYEVLRKKLGPAAVAHLNAIFVRARYSGDLVGLTRHGKGSMLQALVNDDSIALAIQLESANSQEAKITPALLDKMPDVVVADRAYDLDELRDEFAKRTSKVLAPHRSNRQKPPRDQEQMRRHYKQRWRVERLFAWLVDWRRRATRWEANPLNCNGRQCTRPRTEVTEIPWVESREYNPPNILRKRTVVRGRFRLPHAASAVISAARGEHNIPPRICSGRNGI